VALARPGVRTEVLILRKTGSAVDVIRKLPTSIDPYRLRLSPNGDRLLVMERVRHTWMLLLDTATGNEVGHLDIEGLSQTNDLDWLDDHRLVGLQTLFAKRGNPGAVERITVWDAETGKILHSAINPTAMNALAISPDGSRIAEAGSDKILRIRDSATLKVIQQFRVHDTGITALAWNPRPFLGRHRFGGSQCEGLGSGNRTRHRGIPWNARSTSGDGVQSLPMNHPTP
jgi:WD40 repeat protein